MSPEKGAIIGAIIGFVLGYIHYMYLTRRSK